MVSRLENIHIPDTKGRLDIKDFSRYRFHVLISLAALQTGLNVKEQTAAAVNVPNMTPFLIAGQRFIRNQKDHVIFSHIQTLDTVSRSQESNAM